MQPSRPWVIVPGIWDSGPDHWQSRWQVDRGAEAVRIVPRSWSEPDPDDWDDAISRTVDRVPAPPVVIAHSLGVLAVATWLVRHPDRAAGAFLVAPPDPLGDAFPSAASGFTEPTGGTNTPAQLVVSDDDPYCSLDRALGFARVLGAQPVRVGAAGHVNVASGLGEWRAGRALLAAFERTL
ncbi:alpha/beta hydrolase [Curtobacterium sp. ISL-83]|uniref:RBBP9/YdeN family alpha/beta hydrolase n=1 Tax=Curtobacterium sp. ISL-83 TaxID=2819145 RepID=UPI001BE760F4|nr:alpha/beta hydrolase [Curtobacterium sp. ISL-83]MBT2503823.1 alpha/beta hydrolase [Curtobacterium sp. ISL-83]